jgi:hypothetical protein
MHTKYLIGNDIRVPQFLLLAAGFNSVCGTEVVYGIVFWYLVNWKKEHSVGFVRGVVSISFLLTICRAGDSSVGIATGYGLDGPRIESLWGARFSAPVQTCPVSHPASYTVGTGLSRE